jgi:NAD+ kinase
VAHVYLSYFSERLDAAKVALEVADELTERNIPCSLVECNSATTPTIHPDDIVVSLGGDGTFLRSARIAHAGNARVLGVSLGRLGFLLHVQPSAVTGSVISALSNTGFLERQALSVSLPTGESYFALNEALVERSGSGRMVRATTFIDEEEYLTYHADAVMVATPTGSTGHNFSAGGPVVDDTVPVLILTPVAPHFTIDRSIVVNDSRQVRIQVETKADVVADGNVIATLSEGDSVRISRATHPVRVVASPDFELIGRLRRGLREGHA